MERSGFAEKIEQARRGKWEIILTPIKPVPREWFGDVRGKDVLCLASGGGQQVPILAAAGANVTSFDNSAKQLNEINSLRKERIWKSDEQGDAKDLSRFENEAFDLIFHPCSNCFMSELQPIWNECYSVLRSGGVLLSGFNHPFVYVLTVAPKKNEMFWNFRHKIPYSDIESWTEEEFAKMIDAGEPLEFSHTLDEQIGGQIEAGFLIGGFYEDWWTDEARILNKYIPTFVATKAVKL